MADQGKQKREPAFELIAPATKPQQAQQAQPAPAPIKRQVSFDDWWTLVAHSRKLSPGMKEAVKIHMSRTGFLKSGQFDAGLKHFGVK